jgi:hypothetical protein
MGEWWVLVEERKVDWGLWAVAEGVGGSGGHAPWKGGPWSLEVALPWRVAAKRDVEVESEKRERS